jgi:hypothetical protein
MDKQSQKVATFRKKAADLRATVEAFSSPARQRDVLEIAQQYEILADQIERTGVGKKEGEN